MKKLAFLLVPVLVINAQCKKLPQVDVSNIHGLNTFSCTVNGVNFTPSGSTLIQGGVLSNYTLISQNQYVFLISARDAYGNPTSSVDIKVYTSGLKIGDKISLTKYDTPNTGGADYFISNTYDILPPLTGELDITYFDSQQRFVGGTFYFDAIDSNGNKVAIRDGKFEIKY